MSAPHSAYAEAFRLLREGLADHALAPARRAVAAATSCSPAHGLLASILLQLGKCDEARTAISQALDCFPGGGDAYDSLAFASLQLGDHEVANAIYRRAVEIAPNEARFLYNLASSERSFGRLTEAELLCDRAIFADPGHFQSYLLRSELRTQSDSNNHVASMERLLANCANDDRACMFVGYALGKELDDLAHYDRAFAWFTRAASARRRHLSYDVGADERKIGRIRQVYPSARDTCVSLLERSKQHIFIMGLPRSGTTLVERVLMRLPDVTSNGETENFSAALLSAASATGPDLFARCASAEPSLVAERYQERAARGATGKVIEKLPLNYLYVAAIQHALPGAAPIQVVRSPLDSCFAMYRTLFGAAYPYSYDFKELARYYAAYADLMQHWQNLFGEWLMRVRYEDLVCRPEMVGAAMARKCGLPWSDEAVAIERSDAVSTTASAAQIRRPIYQSSVGRWRHYRSHLEPLVTALRDAGIREPDADD